MYQHMTLSSVYHWHSVEMRLIGRRKNRAAVSLAYLGQLSTDM